MVRSSEDNSSSISLADETAPIGKPKSLGELFQARGGSLLVLRAFLGVTFLFAGLQKLANPNFFHANAPGSFVQQLHGAISTSPLHQLLDPALHAPTLIALLISFAEVAVGLGTLLGIFTRLAAIGGMLLALIFFLVISFNDNPYYYGPDIVFLFAWTPLVIARPGTWTLDEVYRRRIARYRAQSKSGKNSPSVTDEIERRVVLQRGPRRRDDWHVGPRDWWTHCGHRPGISRAYGGCNFGRSDPSIEFPNSNIFFGAIFFGAIFIGAIFITSRVIKWRGATEGREIGPATAVPVGGAASFTDPISSVPALVVQPDPGSFAAFSAVCPHAGCIVAFDKQQDLFVCPCHGSMFNGKNGSVVQGPAVQGLTPISVKLEKNGNLYVLD